MRAQPSPQFWGVFCIYANKAQHLKIIIALCHKITHFCHPLCILVLELKKSHKGDTPVGHFISLFFHTCQQVCPLAVLALCLDIGKPMPNTSKQGTALLALCLCQPNGALLSNQNPKSNCQDGASKV